MALANGELAVEIDSGVATLTLNRPAVLNALSFGMLEALTECLDAWESDEAVATIVLRGAGGRAFCAGGDIRALHEAFGKGDRGHMRYFEVEYALDLSIHEYPKPIVALIDGVVMGGGMGLAQGARLRVVGERTRMAMPETAIGLFPDVGGSYFLSRLPGGLGRYLGLVGPTIGAADALYCGLADIYLPPSALESFSAVDSARLGVARLDGGELESLRPAIDEHFGQPGVQAIVASLAREDRDPWREWAGATREALMRRSPTMLEVTFEQLRRGASMTLAQCFRMELGLVAACFEQGDFLEGIRALMIDKDNRPRWRPATLAQVTPAMVDRFFNQGKP